MPQYTDADYEYIRKYRRGGFGKPLSGWEYKVSGVPMGAHVNDIIKSLGKPTSEEIKYVNAHFGRLPLYHLEYGGVSFDTTYRYWYHNASEGEHISRITITNRDATTARGITVGDTLKEVYNAYGRPTYIDSDNVWLYGIMYPDGFNGIYFYNDRYKVKEIKIELGD